MQHLRAVVRIRNCRRRLDPIGTSHRARHHVMCSGFLSERDRRCTDSLEELTRVSKRSRFRQEFDLRPEAGLPLALGPATEVHRSRLRVLQIVGCERRGDFLIGRDKRGTSRSAAAVTVRRHGFRIITAPGSREGSESGGEDQGERFHGCCGRVSGTEAIGMDSRGKTGGEAKSLHKSLHGSDGADFEFLKFDCGKPFFGHFEHHWRELDRDEQLPPNTTAPRT